ncbi:MAG: 5'-nucleotidase [Phycisphaerales bacterium]|jgi:5'-nucleotidase
MRILLTNDDGIDAPGIRALHAALTGIDPASKERFGGPIGGPDTEVYTVAPLTVQSATSHGVTFHEPLMTRPTPINGHPGVAVDGRPADCVKVGLTELWPQRFGAGTRPDLVVSGMNAGANVGINVIYSGTVAAAIEAAFMGVPSIAVSQHLGRGRPDFDCAARHARCAIEQILTADGGDLSTVRLEKHEVLNINIPRCEAPEQAADVNESVEEQAARSARAGLPAQPPSGTMPDDNGGDFEPDLALAGPDADDPHDPEAALPLVVCPMNVHGHCDKFEKRSSPGGQTYYWSASGGFDFHEIDAGSDVELLFRRCITLTPLSYDLTHRAGAASWAQRLGAGAQR